MGYEVNKIPEYSEEALIAEIKRVSKIVKSDTLSAREFDKHARIRSSTVANKLGGWNNALQKAGLNITKKAKYSDQEIFREIKRVWDLLGRQPLVPDLRKHSRISRAAIASHFGGVIKAYESFQVWLQQQPQTGHSSNPPTSFDSPVEVKIIEATTNSKRS